MSGSRTHSLRLIWAAWTIPAVLSTFETIMQMGLAGRPMPLWRAFASEAPGYYVWALFTPAVARLAARFPLGPSARIRNLAPHLGAWLVVASASALVSTLLSITVRGTRTSAFGVLWRSWLFGALPFSVTAYAGVVIVCAFIANRERLAAREREAAELARALSEAQLSALRAQLQPHFLFNSLNGIIALVRDADTARAAAALESLSQLLRSALRLGAAPEVALSDEVTFVRDYLALEGLRFTERLDVTISIPPELLNAAVPTFTLQLLTENAVKHNLMAKRPALRIAVSAAADGVALVLRVTDNGVGPGATVDATKGVGLANLRTRLATMFGGAAAIALAPNAGGGSVAEVHLPVRFVDAS
ncbi:MAG TPA: histidine kinase [Gemmatimonadaceae bacterium]|nr:histidine kinase [Gemmatimonadaceae bacterium]